MPEKFIFSDHAQYRLERRNIDPEIVRKILRKYEDVIAAKTSRFVLQNMVDFGDGKHYLVRIIIDADRRPPEVVTVYITSKLKKYGAAT